MEFSGLRFDWYWLVVTAIVMLGVANPALGQTASTGALAGVTLDPAGAPLPDVSLTLIDPKTSGAKKSQPAREN